LAIAITLISIACSSIFPPDPQITNESVSKPRELTIWWEQGYNLEEDQALQTVVNNWQKQTGYKAKLSFFTNDELIPKVERAVEANQLPDLMMSSKGNQILYPRLAWQDRLEDVADLIKPIQADYSKEILQAITYSNNHQGKRSYYGVPIHQTTILIFYWQKLLASVGLKSSDIPQNWDDFWQFWQQAQVQLKEQNLDIYSLGFPLAGDKSK
jgi:multiple sugar transport system substrate-binding protein